MREYSIPLKHKTGKFNLKELDAAHENALLITHDEYDILTYTEPEYGNEITVYSVMEDEVNNTLTAFYDKNERLKTIKITSKNKKRLVYIRFDEDKDVKETLKNFAEIEADSISDEIIKCREKIARLFIEYFYDGESFDYAAKIGTINDMEKVLDKYQNDLQEADFSGNYPVKNRISCDCETFGIMLKCANCENDFFYFTINMMTEKIRENIKDMQNIDSNFKFIAGQYD